MLSRKFWKVGVSWGMILIIWVACEPTKNESDQKVNDTSSVVWSKDRANEWFAELGWVSGCNFNPSTSINQLEFWQEETWDPETIDRELGWAVGLGFNIMRVYLHYLPWQQDADAFKLRIEEYLEISTSHGIKTMFVLFDDCWYGNAQLGPQPDPVPGLHNSYWLQCPRYAEVMDTTVWRVLEAYTKDIMSSFKDDDRVVIWDLYNEPANNHKSNQQLPLLKEVVKWAREVNPKQPLTMGVWHFGNDHEEINAFQIANSDVITFHNYSNFEKIRQDIDQFLSYDRPVICTEYLARANDSKFQTHFPYFKEKNVGAINWGLVTGKTQTMYPWSSPLGATEPEQWHHDILRANGEPFDSEEIEIIKKVNFKK